MFLKASHSSRSSLTRPSWSSPVPHLEGSIWGYCHFPSWGSCLWCVSGCGCSCLHLSRDVNLDRGPEGLPSELKALKVGRCKPRMTVVWSRFHLIATKASCYFAPGEGCSTQTVWDQTLPWASSRILISCVYSFLSPFLKICLHSSKYS